MDHWQQQLKSAVRSVGELQGYAFATHLPVEKKFRTLVPQYYLNLIDASDANDPIAKMAFPAQEELALEGLRDPIGDLAKQVAPRLTHRYKDRVLLHVTNLCPMYCRFCFRKNLMNESDDELYSGDFAAAITYLKQHPEVQEVIFTGGDPFMLGDDKLRALVSDLYNQVPHLKRFRFHSRMPVTLPARITEELCGVLSSLTGKQVIVVSHFNHEREVTEEAQQAVTRLKNAGVMVLNQSVLLRGVNGSVEALRSLFVALGNIGVLPYYLHHCDLVAGAQHFRVSIQEGQRIWRELRGQLPGYLLPEYVIEIPGGGGKIPVSAEFVVPLGDGTYELRGHGNVYSYKE